MSRTDELTVLSNGLDQVESLLAEVTAERLGEPTPCADWTVRELIDHVVQGTANFADAVRGHEVDWSSSPQHADWLAAYRQNAERLRVAWQEAEGTPELGMGVQSAEFAVHTWDLAQALGRPTADLDPALAEGGLAFMRASLTPEMRGSAFGPEQPAPEVADAYQRIAAFAGRKVA